MEKTMNHRDVKAFISSIAFKEQIESGSKILNTGKTTVIRARNPMLWEWSRQFSYEWEFFTYEEDASLIFEAVNRYIMSSGQEHVLDVFNPDPESIVPELESQGYQCAWISPVMGRNLSEKWPTDLQAHHNVTYVSTIDEQRMVASLRGISNDFDEMHPRIQNFFISNADQVIAKGQLISQDSDIGYVSDMFTAESERRRGCCHAIMEAIECYARGLEESRCILAPGLMTIEMALYEKYGYKTSARRAVMIPRRGSS